MKKKKQFWAAGLGSDYWIEETKPDTSDCGSLDGPFDTLAKAKAKIRVWVRSDRGHLSMSLWECMRYKPKKEGKKK